MAANESREFMEELLRSHCEEIVGGLYRAFLKMDPATLEPVLAEQAAACCARFLRLVDLPPDLDLDGFLARMERVGPGRIRIERNGPEILWREEHEGQCACPLVRREIVPLNDRLCLCAAFWLKGLIETFYRRPVTVELVETIASGASGCTFRIRLQQPETGEGNEPL